MYLRTKKKSSREVSLYEPIGTVREGNEIQLFDVIETEGEDAHSKVELKEDIQMCIRDRIFMCWSRQR